jgi:hypothetical protein
MLKEIAAVAVACAAVAAMTAHARLAAAEGALAFALPQDTARDGFAYGVANDFATRADAEAEAMQRCLGFKDAPAETRTLCRIVASYSGQCVAIALDPRNGVTGEGWAVESSKQAADQAALNRCRATASRDRGRLCKVDFSYCDKR